MVLTPAARLDEARAHAQAGRLPEALAAARDAARTDPRLSEAFAIWGVAAAELGAFGEAAEPLATAAGRVPPGSMGWVNVTSQLARVLSNTGFWAEALRRAAAVEAADPPDPAARLRIGAAFSRMNLAERGLIHLEWAAERAPDWPELLFELGLALMTAGRLDEAEQRFERAVALAPDLVRAHMALAELRRWTPETAHLERLQAARADPSLPPADRARLGYALFKELDDLGRTGEAWPVLAEANDVSRAEEAPDWTAEADAELIQALIETFPATRLAQAAPPGGPVPIFIVGLPRSGTTLVERILAAHSQVRALGEVPAFPMLFRSAARLADRSGLNAATVRATAEADWARIGEAYLAETLPFADGSPVFIDKLPANSLFVGAIRRALPQARIVHMRREPMDSLFGAYKVRFGGWYGWSYRLEDLAAHHRHHEALMAHWREALGTDFVEADYEALVSDPEPHIRRLLNALGLPFEPACLEPEKTAGAVRTASVTQVRGAIDTSRIGNWRRYAAELEPLQQALGLGLRE